MEDSDDWSRGVRSSYSQQLHDEGRGMVGGASGILRCN